jgi:hypothetical protein
MLAYDSSLQMKILIGSGDDFNEEDRVNKNDNLDSDDPADVAKEVVN